RLPRTWREWSLWPPCHSPGFPHGSQKIIDLLHFPFAGPAVLHFDGTLANAARPDNHLPGQPDKIRRCELRTRPVVGVVIKHFAPCRFVCGQQFFAERVAAGIAGLHVDERDMEGGYRLRPYDAVLVMTGLYDGCHKAGRTDPIRAAGNEMILAVRASHLRPHRPRIFVAKVKDVANLDTARRKPVGLRDLGP